MWASSVTLRCEAEGASKGDGGKAVPRHPSRRARKSAHLRMTERRLRLGLQHPFHQRHRRQDPADARDHVIGAGDPRLLKIGGNWATAMATSAQTITSANSATVPNSLRTRTDIEASPLLRRGGQDYMVRDLSGKPQSQVDARTNPAFIHARWSALWLTAVAALMVLTLVVGGATRLTNRASPSSNGSRSPA